MTRIPEIGNTSVWVLPNIWRLGWVMDTKFGTIVSNRMLLNTAKFQGYSFYRFWVIKGNPTGGRDLDRTSEKTTVLVLEPSKITKTFCVKTKSTPTTCSRNRPPFRGGPTAPYGSGNWRCAPQVFFVRTMPQTQRQHGMSNKIT